MSADEFAYAVPKLKLGEYIAALIEALSTANPGALARMRQVVGDRRARIILDNEVVDISFSPTKLHVQTAMAENEVNGIGQTDTNTVLALLDGYLEVVDAIFEGRLHVYGVPNDITAIFTAIEILLDASPRTHALQELAARFRRERSDPHDSPMPSKRRTRWYPFGSEESEYKMLARFDLL